MDCFGIYRDFLLDRLDLEFLPYGPIQEFAIRTCYSIQEVILGPCNKPPLCQKKKGTTFFEKKPPLCWEK
jgi:hypothetical protein